MVVCPPYGCAGFGREADLDFRRPLEFQMRAKNAWLKLHKPELLEQFKFSDFELHLVEQGTVNGGLWRKPHV